MDERLVIAHPQHILQLNRSAGERAMLIKTAEGDRMAVFGNWANRKKGVAGTADVTHSFLLVQKRNICIDYNLC